MKLTRTERLILANQYLLLAKAYPDEADAYERRHTAVASGYVYEYDSLFEHIYEKEFSEDDARFVIDVMSMYEALQDADTSERTVFLGFGLNNEASYVSYARYYRSDFAEPFGHLRVVTESLDAHMPMLSLYRAMLSEWKKSADERRLTNADVERILGAKGHA